MFSRSLTIGEQEFVGVIDTQFLSQAEKRALQLEKLERFDSYLTLFWVVRLFSLWGFDF